MPTKQKPPVRAISTGQSDIDQASTGQEPTFDNSKPTAKRRWSVTIPYVPPTVIEAADESDAWEKFKAKWRIVKSEHIPAITADSKQ
jgi:hypothetical protein